MTARWQKNADKVQKEILTNQLDLVEQSETDSDSSKYSNKQKNYKIKT